jgi:hypothetical protein
MNKIIKITSLLSLAAGFVLIGAIAHAQVPQLMNYQGVLKDSGGTPIDGTVSIVFSIYDVSTGGTALWSETQGSVSVTGGLFNVLLGSSTALPAGLFYGTYAPASSPDRYLGVKVGIDPEMTPRQRLVSVSDALKAEDADTLGDGAVITTKTNGVDTVGIGIANPRAKLHVINGLMIGHEVSNTTKFSYIAGTEYDNDAEPEGFTLFHIRGGISTNEIRMGGSISGQNAATHIEFFTAPDITTHAGTEKMRIDSAGNVGIGTTSPTERLDVAGKVRATAFITPSSRELKKGITPLGREDYQEIMHQINGIQMVRYLYKTESNRQPHLGVIAEDSPPEILDPAGKAVSLSDYAGFILAGLKAQADQIRAQSEQIKTLTEKIEALEAKQAN